MGMSVDAAISFGLFVNVGDYLWDEEKEEDRYPDFDVDDFWYNIVCGYKPPFEVWNKKGERLEGIMQDDIDAFYVKFNNFKIKHPNPIGVQYIWNSEHDELVLTYEEFTQTCADGGPEEVNLENLKKDTAKATEVLKHFCEKMKIPFKEPKWYMTCIHW